MSWSAQDQEAAIVEMIMYIEQTNAAFEAYVNGLQSGQPQQTLAALEDVLRRWRQSIQKLRVQTDTLIMSEGVIDALNQIVATVEDEKALLTKLRSESVTRTDQAVSVNPKVTPSPYTNILGLQRTFRSSTRQGIMIATIVFAVLAVGLVGYLGYQAVAGGLGEASYPGVARGGARDGISLRKMIATG